MHAPDKPIERCNDARAPSSHAQSATFREGVLCVGLAAACIRKIAESSSQSRASQVPQQHVAWKRGCDWFNSVATLRQATEYSIQNAALDLTSFSKRVRVLDRPLHVLLVSGLVLQQSATCGVSSRTRNLTSKSAKQPSGEQSLPLLTVTT